MAHELKTHPEYFEAVKQGLKLFEVRENDRNYKVDDILILKEYEPYEKLFTGRSIHCRVTYMLDNPLYIKHGFVILGFVITIHSEGVENDDLKSMDGYCLLDLFVTMADQEMNGYKKQVWTELIRRIYE